MSDIVERLRETAAHNYAYRSECTEAADEIDRLRERLSSKERHCANAEAEVWKLRGLLREALDAHAMNGEDWLHLCSRIHAALAGKLDSSAVQPSGDCGCSQYEFCIDKPNCKRAASPTTPSHQDQG